MYINNNYLSLNKIHFSIISVLAQVLRVYTFLRLSPYFPITLASSKSLVGVLCYPLIVACWFSVNPVPILMVGSSTASGTSVMVDIFNLLSKFSCTIPASFWLELINHNTIRLLLRSTCTCTWRKSIIAIHTCNVSTRY